MHVVIGADGMLGAAWMNLLAHRGIPHRAALYPVIDLSEPATIAAALDVEPADVVINCAAYTDVDGAEADEAAANLVNGTGVGHLVDACDERGIPLIHYSTDYVFDGRASAPYAIDHPIDPVNAYGRSKRLGEEAVLASDGAHLMIRTSWLYAPWGKNFVRTIAGLAKSRPSLRVVDDQRGRPTSAEHLAELSLALYEGGARGVYHGTDGGECTWFGFARAIAARVNPACVVEPCTTAEFPRPAVRPAYSVLDLSGTEERIGPRAPWTEHLASVLDRLV
ncbi:MAG: dTDP-4-dehydrorhamnose reductase [Sandaracinaceae bacterium]